MRANPLVIMWCYNNLIKSVKATFIFPILTYNYGKVNIIKSFKEISQEPSFIHRNPIDLLRFCFPVFQMITNWQICVISRARSIVCRCKAHFRTFNTLSYVHLKLIRAANSSCLLATVLGGAGSYGETVTSSTET